jgi:hypothetical protein
MRQRAICGLAELDIIPDEGGRDDLGQSCGPGLRADEKVSTSKLLAGQGASSAEEM